MLNVLWFVCCIPLITIGASTAALWDVILRRVRDEDPSIVRDFFGSFKVNFKRGTQSWGLIFGAGCLLTVNFTICHLFEELQILELVFVALFLCLIGLCQYLFPLVSQCDGTFRELIKTAAFLAVGYLPKTLMVTSVALLPVIAAFGISYGMFGVLLCVAFVVALAVWINAKVLSDIFSNFSM